MSSFAYALKAALRRRRVRMRIMTTLRIITNKSPPTHAPIIAPRGTRCFEEGEARGVGFPVGTGLEKNSKLVLKRGEFIVYIHR